MNALTHTEPQELLPADPMVSMIERIAMDPQADLEKLERMLQMKERLEDKAAQRSFAAAISDAKSKIGPIIKTGTVDYTNSKDERTYFKHETLDGIAMLVDPILAEHGLSYRYKSRQENGNLFVTCVVSHRDGYSEETTLQGGPDSGAGKNNYQAIGSAATYLQRYTLKLALGLSAAKDTDAIPPKGGALTEEQFRELTDLVERSGADEAKFLLAYAAPSMEEFPATSFDAACAQLTRKMGGGA